MKIQVMSDLHVNQDRLVARDLPEVQNQADVLVIAGDTVDKDTLELPKFLDWYSSIKKPIVFIMGNHEYDGWNSVVAAPKQTRLILEKYNRNTIFLENGVKAIEGYLFVGATLFSYLDPLKEVKMRTFMNSRYMPGDLTGYWWNDKFSKSSRFIDFVLHNKTTELSKTIVVTHFGPTFQTMNMEYKDNYSNDYFFSDLDYILENKGPRLWIHGHTHKPFRGTVGMSELVVNPRGYTRFWGDEENPGFDPALIIEV